MAIRVVNPNLSTVGGVFNVLSQIAGQAIEGKGSGGQVADLIIQLQGIPVPNDLVQRIERALVEARVEIITS